MKNLNINAHYFGTPFSRGYLNFGRFLFNIMKNFINQFKDYQLQKGAIHFVGDLKVKFCFNPVTQSYFTALNFSDNYIINVQKCEVLIG